MLEVLIINTKTEHMLFVSHKDRFNLEGKHLDFILTSCFFSIARRENSSLVSVSALAVGL